MQKDFFAFCHIKLTPHTQEYVVKFGHKLNQLDKYKLDKLLECHHLSGDYDCLLKVLVRGLSSFREFMVDKLIKIDHIGGTYSMFMINEVKHTTVITL